jgi:hypothetical protein
MLLRLIGIAVVAGFLFVLAWYFWFRRCNRRKAAEVLRWVELAFHGRGRVAGVRWLSASSFQARLRLSPSGFRRAFLKVRLLPREMPVLWLVGRTRGQQETVTFQADLDSPPNFDLEVHNHRWYGRTRRHTPRKSEDWTMQPVGPFVLTTRNDWQREITSMMSALVASRECDCSTVCFRRASPHFSVTVPLETITPTSQTQTEIFDVLRELAAGASTARF